MSLLLFSNSTMAGEPYLAWTRPWLDPFLEGVENIVFIPYAAVDISYDDYTARVNTGLGMERIVGIHTAPEKAAAISNADCIVVGGGNTFSLLCRCQEEGLLDAIRAAVAAGAKYVGWSAGANLACPTIKTTNDMPIESPRGLEALGLIPFQINPHFIAEAPQGHAGESRVQRIKEFLIRNPELPVLGMPEGSLLSVEERKFTLEGKAAMWFQQEKEALRLAPGPLNVHLSSGAH
ncbi:MAG: dipeptidase PepE [Candidatus Hydrogenedentes bacterium]|nr:dipeptidase PepE [Candidatus Hydrogenedentota bacterium]